MGGDVEGVHIFSTDGRTGRSRASRDDDLVSHFSRVRIEAHDAATTEVGNPDSSFGINSSSISDAFVASSSEINKDFFVRSFSLLDVVIELKQLFVATVRPVHSLAVRAEATSVGAAAFGIE